MSKISPYQFESKNISNSESSWTTVNTDEEESDTEVEQNLAILNRMAEEVSVWCKCSHCKTMPVNKEYLCCPLNRGNTKTPLYWICTAFKLI